MMAWSLPDAPRTDSRATNTQMNAGSKLTANAMNSTVRDKSIKLAICPSMPGISDRPLNLLSNGVLLADSTDTNASPVNGNLTA